MIYKLELGKTYRNHDETIGNDATPLTGQELVDVFIDMKWDYTRDENDNLLDKMSHDELIEHISTYDLEELDGDD